MSEYLNKRLLVGNCLDKLKELADNSIDSIVTDPPYELGFMGKSWDNTGIAFNVAIWQECMRVLKPGGHLLAFSGSRTYHRMAVAIEDAGFEIRDQIMWIYGSGFPKSLDVSKAIDKSTTKAAKQWTGWGTALKPAHEPIVLARKPLAEKTVAENVLTYSTGAINIDATRVGTDGGLTGRVGYDGNGYMSGSATLEELKELADKKLRTPNGELAETVYARYLKGLENKKEPIVTGRFPANLILSHNPDCQLIQEGSIEVTKEIGSKQDFRGDNFGRSDKTIDLERPVYSDTPEIYNCTEGCPFLEFPNTNKGTARIGRVGGQNGLYENGHNPDHIGTWYGDNGTAARFFYCAKASKKERNGGLDGLPNKEWRYDGAAIPERNNRPFLPSKNNHPTVKPIALMSYLIKLITPPKGTVLDPFLGSGSTAVAAILEGFDWKGCELTEDYLPIIKGRVTWAKKQVKNKATQLNLYDT